MEDPNTEGVALLILSDGTVFNGQAFGKKGTVFGEINFNTSMTGYQEMLTDPSSVSQIIVSSNSHIGNYGCRSDLEVKRRGVSGFVCRNFSDHYSRHQGDMSLNDFMKKNEIVGIAGVDTRALVRKIRDKGSLRAVISSENIEVDTLKMKLDGFHFDNGMNVVEEVFVSNTFDYGDENSPLRVAVIDFGVKQSLLDLLVERGAYLRIFPGTTSWKEISEWNPDGVLLSGGPGNPNEMTGAIELAKKVLEDDKPAFGVCLGHQLLAIACGLQVSKLQPGDRGTNQPVLNLITGLGEITAQNHGYGVVREDIEKNDNLLEISHVNLNNNSVEGLRWRDKKIFSVQYHPEGDSGPHDSRYLFDEFISVIKEYKQVKVKI